MYLILLRPLLRACLLAANTQLYCSRAASSAMDADASPSFHLFRQYRRMAAILLPIAPVQSGGNDAATNPCCLDPIPVLHSIVAGPQSWMHHSMYAYLILATALRAYLGRNHQRRHDAKSFTSYLQKK